MTIGAETAPPEVALLDNPIYLDYSRYGMQVERYLQDDDRCVVPLGSTEQHAQLSLSVDSILSERVAAEAAHPLGVPVFPVLAYGITPYFQAYPGTVSVSVRANSCW